MKIFKPNAKPYIEGVIADVNHCGDTFRELVDIWNEMGLCQVENSPDSFCWADEPGDIILYDFPRLDDRHIPPFKKGLFGNTVPDGPDFHAWIFWARSPRRLMEARKSPLKTFKDREIESIFLGKIENNVQDGNRTNRDWGSAGIELFHCPWDRPGPDHYPFTREEYLEKLRDSRFGLCLAGYGPKCNREIELLGMGVVPLFAPEVDNKYHEPLVEGVHFIRVNDPSEVKDVIESVSQDKWEEMVQYGQEWYDRNASPEGSFEVTKKIIEGIR